MSSLPKLKKICSFDPEIFKAVNPVVGIVSYGSGVIEIKRESKLQGHFDSYNGRKGRKVKQLTSKSLQRLIATVQATEIDLTTMLTLTYPKIFPTNGKQVKESLNAVLAKLRSWGTFEYLWFLEFQKRGAPHIHLLTNHGAITPRMRVSVAETWVRHMINSDWFIAGTVVESVNCDKCEYDVIATHVKRTIAVALHRDTWQLVRERDGMKRYVTKYASKPQQKVVPKNYHDVGRFWGCSRNISLSGGKELPASEDDFFAFLDSQEHKASQFDVLPKFVYGVKHT